MTPILFNAKEQRYLDYMAKCEIEEFTPTIGDICRECHTTVLTLFRKTIPSINEKFKKMQGILKELGGGPVAQT
jgi:hypothetical protein